MSSTGMTGVAGGARVKHGNDGVAGVPVSSTGMTGVAGAGLDTAIETKYLYLSGLKAVMIADVSETEYHDY